MKTVTCHVFVTENLRSGQLSGLADWCGISAGFLFRCLNGWLVSADNYKNAGASGVY